MTAKYPVLVGTFHRRMVAYALTVLIGVTQGALGAGGALLMLPMLVYVGGYAPGVAVAMSLVIMVISSLVGTLAYVRDGDFHPKFALVFGIGGIAGAYAGSFATRLVPPSVLMLIFGVLLLTVGIMTLREKTAFARTNPWSPLRCFFIAVGIGLLTGFLGVGGGFLLLPALVRFAGLGHREAVGTSLALTGLNSISGLAGQMRHVSIDWSDTGSFLIFAICGLLAGYVVSMRVPARVLQSAFGWLLVSLGTGMTITSALGHSRLV